MKALLQIAGLELRAAFRLKASSFTEITADLRCDELGTECRRIKNGLEIMRPLPEVIALLRERGWQRIGVPSGFVYRKNGQAYRLEPLGRGAQGVQIREV